MGQFLFFEIGPLGLAYMTLLKNLGVVFVVALAGCSLPAQDRSITNLPGQELRLNDLQVIGSHNSFRKMPPLALLDALDVRRAGLRDAFSYDHPPIANQLDLGVRQIELDVVADPDGGRYAKPFGASLAGLEIERTETEKDSLAKPGYKVLHVADLDYLSHCLTLQACLKDLVDWSDQNPNHLPIMVTVDAKDRPHALADVVDPIALDKTLLDALDEELRRGLGEKLITPDHVRGKETELRTAVLANQWPKLRQARGHFIVIFDVRPEIAELYKVGHPSLKGRAMFAQFPENASEASVFIVQDPRGQEARIAAWVKQGFLVRTRSDAGTVEARSRSISKLAAAQASGAHAISTDYYPGAPDPLSTGFVVDLGGRRMADCNPIRVRGMCPDLRPW